MTKYKLVATAAAGIEALVGKELRNMGYDVQVENGKAFFEGDDYDIARTNIWLRTADRIKIIMGQFTAKTFDSLFEQTKAIPWEKILPVDAEFPVSGKSVKSTLHSVPNCQSIVKKAIVNRLSEAYHRRTHLPESGALYPIEVAILKDVVTLTIDTSGTSLFKRGYRTEKGGAPLKENMAAALVMLTSWYPDKPFYDPTCGSGTIPIEAALIGKNIAPGLNRSFAAEKWTFFTPGVFDKVREEARKERDKREILMRFNQFRDKCNGDWKPDWSTSEEKKYCIALFPRTGLCAISEDVFSSSLTLFGHFKKVNDCKRAIDLFGDEIKRLWVDE